ncbi:MAG: hypothetical protein JO347_12005 [Candidatus Eremiobacteraeota bacterium]|nr:hypothetical protein [Candidatus Eremiobacteraeota bacterium]
MHSDGYYDVRSVELDETYWWLPPKWAGIIEGRDLARPDTRQAFDLLNDLARVGMVQRRNERGAFSYHLTWSALQYYFEGTEYGNNPEGLSFLCYSRIVPESVLWNEPIHAEQIAGVKMDAFRAAIKWAPSPPASWADDAFIRAHSVMLVPANAPLVVKFVRVGDVWETHYESPTSAVPHLLFVNPRAWPRSDLMIPGHSSRQRKPA